VSADEVPTPRQMTEREHDGKPAYEGELVDPWGHDYLLEKRSTGFRWQAVSVGPDGERGTADDIVQAEPRRGGLLGR
jgi:hypothetical protein